ncbi:arsenic resistance protein [Cyanobium sp. Copco_Reservoir_LC18]|uniref:arsenic resistance protein n=1 Tax=Cyanobium sp. Copco_Reservoir_LC18 TaxID=1328305 RepID=UPI001359FBC1|nr:arsenical-resistance protein [Cyanobium sp. Copco_Reservoir_LC18]
MGLFERYLSLWVALGALLPGLSEAVAAFEFARINLLIALLVWGMIYPMMLAVDFGAIAGLRHQPKGLVVTVVVNWLIKPLTMTAIAWLFIRGLFGAWIPAALGDQYVAGMILLGVSNVLVPWDTLVTAVGLFVVVPLAAGWLTRRLLHSPGRLDRLEQRLKPLAIVCLIVTVLLLFLVQARAILANPLAIALIAIPLTLQTYLVFWITARWMRLWRQPHAIAAPGAMIGASNFFELAVAVAISLFGLESGAALATVVGVLVEVPVMLSLVAIANRNRRLFPTAVA